jgi:hypothetical protein
MMDRHGDNNDDDKGYENNGKAMRPENFKMQKNKIFHELNVALNNLKNVRSRVAARITKAESSGRDMTEAKNLLITADAKIVLAQNAVLALNNISATSTGTTTASTTIDLGKPRQVAQGAIKAIRDAQKALNKVVIAIAHAMGYRTDNDDHIILPPPPTTGTTTATTTTTTGGGTGTTTATTTATTTR